MGVAATYHTSQNVKKLLEREGTPWESCTPAYDAGLQASYVTVQFAANLLKLHFDGDSFKESLVSNTQHFMPDKVCLKAMPSISLELKAS